MNFEEALGKITDPEVRKFFETMVSNQNSYITKLENQLKELKATGNNNTGSVDDVTKKYIQEKMREEVIKKSTDKIISIVGKEIYDAVEKDFMEFLSKNMKLENTREDYVIDAFSLVYGRCLTTPNHPVHQAGKTTNPSGTPAPMIGSNGDQVAVVQNIVAGQPPVMSGTDQSAGQGLPGVQGTPVKSTKDAFSRLKEKFSANGGNKFQ